MTIVIDSIVANGLKSESADPVDIEIVRGGTSALEANPRVGTELLKGDWIKTGDDDQVTLRVKYGEEESDDLVLLDPRSHVNIGSVCAVAGRILAWVSSRFRLCTSFGTLGVSGTEFEVEVQENQGLTVLVYEGSVSLDRKTSSVDSANPTPSMAVSPPPAEAVSAKPSASPSPRVLIGEAWSAVRETIPTGKKLMIKADGQSQTADFLPAERAQGIDRWSDQIIRANQKPAGVTKGYVNYSDDQRVEKFKQARREALLDNSSKGYLDMALVLNDWDNGAAAEKSLSKVKDAPLRESQEFMVNEAEAQLLQGNLSKATAQIERTLVKHPGYAPAYYVSGKVSETKASSDPANKANDLEAAKISFHMALLRDPGTSKINKNAVEADLDKTIDTLGKTALMKGDRSTYAHLWFRYGKTGGFLSSNSRDKERWVSYSGTTSLKVGSTQVSGDAVLSIFGNQFKLKTGEKIFTGKITSDRHPRGISFAMTFDNLGSLSVSESVVISVIGTKVANGILLQSVPNRSKSFSFRSRNRFR